MTGEEGRVGCAFGSMQGPLREVLEALDDLSTVAMLAAVV
jgi:hypothetical protein